jgi:transposase-like protein
LHADYHRKRLRTTNMLENLNKQVKRRTRVAGLFPNTESALRLVTAVLMEQSQEWETGKVYLTMTEREKASTTVMRDDPKANLQKRSCSATLRVRT